MHNGVNLEEIFSTVIQQMVSLSKWLHNHKINDWERHLLSLFNAWTHASSSHPALMSGKGIYAVYVILMENQLNIFYSIVLLLGN